MFSAYLIPLLSAVLAQASVLTPPVLPLVVRNPYLNTHLTNARDVPWSNWPIFWTGQELGMSIMASVPDSHLVYPLLGRPHDSLALDDDNASYNVSFPVYLGAQYDASTTNLTYQIPAPPDSDSKEPLEITISFLSPITPTSTLRQAIPASYVEITTSGAFKVDVYMDLNGLWVTAERGTDIEWQFAEIDYKDTPSVRSFRVNRRDEMKFAEIADRAEYGKLYFTGPSDVAYEAGTSAHLRQYFAKRGTLRNRIDDRFRAVMDDEPVFAFHKSFPSRESESQSSNNFSCLFTIAHIRDQVAQFASARGLTEMRPLWSSYFFTDHALLMYHFMDYKHAKSLAEDYAAQVAHDADEAGGQNHVDILAASARQVMGATDFTGTPDDPLLFIKEISSDGNCQTIDVIFPAFPFFAYTNPRWLAYMLEPLLEHMLSGQYPNKYAMHDLGASYPNLTGHPLGRDEYMPVEESGDMLIMGLSLVHSIVDGVTNKLSDLFEAEDDHDLDSSKSVFPLRMQTVGVQVEGLDEPLSKGSKGAAQAKAWLKKSYKLWKQWTEYLVEFSLEPENQLSTDDFAGWLPLQTNLALKGIVGIKAMSELASVMGNHDEFKYYQNISDTYITKWQEFGISRDGSHAKLAYNWYGSWTTLYSLFADALLCFHTDGGDSSDLASVGSGFASQEPLKAGDKAGPSSKNFIAHSVYVKQSSHYTLALQKYGLPLDSRHLYTKSDWEFQVAAASSPALRREIIERTARWLNETETNTPFSDLYLTEEKGNYAPGTRFTARPVIGSHFSILALDKACGKAIKNMEWDVALEEENLRIANAETRW